MSQTRAIFHRNKSVSIYPMDGDRFLIEAILQDEVHDVHVEVEILHPTLEIVAARSEVRNGPFTNVCNLTHPNMDRLVGMRVGRGFTLDARKAVGGGGGCHRVSELVVEIAQAAYQLHFVRFFAQIPEEQRQRADVPEEPRQRADVPEEPRQRADVPIDRWRAVNAGIPGMRNTCFTYSDERESLIAEKAEPLVLRSQTMPAREID